jgi:hypothetical protein
LGFFCTLFQLEERIESCILYGFGGDGSERLIELNTGNGRLRHPKGCLFLCPEKEEKMEYRNKQMNFRVTESEYQTIRKRMELTGIEKPGAYLRRMAMYGYVLRLDLSDLKEILRLVHINSNNLNQYAKKANETGSIYAADIEDLKNGQQEILKLLRNIYERLLSAIK